MVFSFFYVTRATIKNIPRLYKDVSVHKSLNSLFKYILKGIIISHNFSQIYNMYILAMHSNKTIITYS